MQLTEANTKLEVIQHLSCACQLVTIHSTPFRDAEQTTDTHHQHRHSFLFFFFFPQDFANYVPRLKEIYQAPYNAFILVALVTFHIPP